MKQVSCEQLGADCHYVASGNTDQEVKDKLVKHGWDAHKDDMEKMTEDEKMKMDKQIDELLAQQA